MHEAITHEIRKYDAEASGEISAYAEIRFPDHAPLQKRTAVRAALRLLTSVVLEIVVRAREAQGVHGAPAQIESREADGSRWNG